MYFAKHQLNRKKGQKVSRIFMSLQQSFYMKDEETFNPDVK